MPTGRAIAHLACAICSADNVKVRSPGTTTRSRKPYVSAILRDLFAITHTRVTTETMDLRDDAIEWRAGCVAIAMP